MNRSEIIKWLIENDYSVLQEEWDEDIYLELPQSEIVEMLQKFQEHLKNII